MTVLRTGSLANLLLLPAWIELLPWAPGAYFYGYTIGWASFASLAVHGVLWTALLLFAQTWFRRGSDRGLFFRASICAVSLLAVNALRFALVESSLYLNLAEMVTHFGWPLFLALYTPPIIALCVWITLDLSRAIRVGSLILTLFIPLPFLLSIQCAISSTPKRHIKTHFIDRRPLPAPAVFFIFDEMDQTWTFDSRPEHIKIPNLERLRLESVYCIEAYPPNSETFRSIPSLLNGNVVSDARISPGRELLLSFRESPTTWVPWSQAEDLPVVFQKSGRTSLFINHYHAFSQTYLAARPMLTVRRAPYYLGWDEAKHWYDSFWSSFHRQARCQAGALPFLGKFVRRNNKDRSIPALFRRTFRESMQGIRSGDYDLLIVHWPIPHAPALLELESGRVPDTPPTGRSNLDNLALVDQVVGMVRDELEARGVWDDALVVVSSDHWQRKAADPQLPPSPHQPGMIQSRRRVPCLIKFPGQAKGLVRRQPISNVEIFDVMSAFAQGIPGDPEAFIHKPPRTTPLGVYRSGLE